MTLVKTKMINVNYSNRCLVTPKEFLWNKLSLPVPVRTEFIRAGGHAGITTQDFFIFFIDLKRGPLPPTRGTEIVGNLKTLLLWLLVWRTI